MDSVGVILQGRLLGVTARPPLLPQKQYAAMPGHPDFVFVTSLVVGASEGNGLLCTGARRHSPPGGSALQHGPPGVPVSHLWGLF